MSNIKSNVVHINNNEPTNNTLSLTEKSQLLDTCKGIASKHLKKRLQYMFDNVDDFLFDLADKAENSTEQTLYFDSMREIRLQKAFIETDFHEQFNIHYTDSLKSINNDDELEAKEKNAFSESVLDGLLLVEDDELEESLAISNMISKSHNLFREQLFGLDQRLSYLLNLTGLETEKNPLGPGNICSAFKSAVNRIDANIKVKLIVYKLFDKYVVQYFDELYQEINKSLIHKGVLPNIKVKIQNRTSNLRRPTPDSNNNANTMAQDVFIDGTGQFPNSPEGQLAATQPVQTGGGQAVSDTFPMAHGTGGVFSTLQELLSNQREFTTTANISTMTSAELQQKTQTVNSTNNFQPADILTALSLMQTSTAATDHIGETIKTDIAHEIVKKSGATAGNNISTPDTDAIDIVSMLFDFILDDNNIPDCMKAIIGRLQIPILKVAILDNSFFGKKSHPARQLLNELANAEIDWEEENQTQSDPLFLKIKEIVDRIVKTFDDDVSIFSELLLEYHEFKEDEQEINETLKEELLAAKIAVAKEIGERIIFKIPDSIRCFITEVWKDVLLLIYMRDNKESIGWLTAIQVMDDLIWSVQPKVLKSERDKLVKIIPKLLQGLQDGLTLISYDQIEKETLFQGLQRYHIASLKGESENIDSPTNSENRDTESNNNSVNNISNLSNSAISLDKIEGMENDDDDLISDDTFYHIALDRGKGDDAIAPTLDDPISVAFDLENKYITMAKDIELGKWVEFTNQDGKKSKGKLVWKSEVMGEYTFVDRKYSIVADKTTRELAVDFSKGTAIIVIDVPLFDRALEAVINGLKKVTQKSETAISEEDVITQEVT